MLYTNCVNCGKPPRIHAVATIAIVAGLTSALAAFEPELDTPARAVCRLDLPIAIDAGGMRPFDRSTLEQQATRIWRPYGVDLDWRSDHEPSADVAHLSVSVIAAMLPSTDLSIAWIPFVNGAPQPLLRASSKAAERVVSSAVRTVWSRTVPNTTLVAQTLGRAVAHEVGHYLLKTSEHSRTGLMRLHVPFDDFLEPLLTNFALEPAEAHAIRELLADECHPAASAAAWPDRGRRNRQARELER